MEEFEKESCVRGYHVYNEIWVAALGEQLGCQRELENPSDHYAVAVVKNATIIGHLPCKISKICSLFIRKRGVVTCTVVGSRRFSADLPQGGMEIPCILHFKGMPKEVKKLVKLMSSKK